MSSLHGSYETTVKASGPTQLATVASTEGTHQTTIDAANSVVGLNLINGNASFVSTVATANTTKLEALANAEKTKQASSRQRREALRADTVGDGAKI